MGQLFHLSRTAVRAKSDSRLIKVKRNKSKDILRKKANQNINFTFSPHEADDDQNDQNWHYLRYGIRNSFPICLVS